MKALNSFTANILAYFSRNSWATNVGDNFVIKHHFGAIYFHIYQNE